MRAINKLFVVIDTEVKDGFNKSFVTKFYQKSSTPKEICAKMNRIEKEMGLNEKRYEVVEIAINETMVTKRQKYIEKEKSRMWNEFTGKYLKYYKIEEE